MLCIKVHVHVQILTLCTCRFLVEHIDRFSGEESSVVWHIPHETSDEMSKKSVVVRLYNASTSFTLLLDTTWHSIAK